MQQQEYQHVRIFKPSTAEVTVIDGVITPSAKSVLPPINAKTYAQLYLFLNNANKAKIPPSPLLLALKRNDYIFNSCLKR